MKHFAVATAVLLPFLIGAPVAGANEPAREFLQEHTFLKVKIDGRPYRLEALIVKQAGRRGKLPLALINHGKPSGLLRMSRVRAERYIPVARDFAMRGYLAVAIVRRGFGRSDGPIPVSLNCSSKQIMPRFDSGADDISAAVASLAGRPDADTSRVVALGVSAGGGAALALAARNPAWLKAVVNISGGLRFPRCSKADLLVSTFAIMGMRSKTPALWFYAENDSLFPPALVYRLHEAYLDAGGNVQRMRVSKIRRDGHRLFTDLSGRRKWLHQTASFLRDQGLPTWELDAVAANMKRIGMKKSSRIAMENYLSLPGVKAMAYSTSASRVIAFYGLNRLDVVRYKAIRACRKRTGNTDCRIVMENFRVVSTAEENSGNAGRDEDKTMTLLQKLGLKERRLSFLDRYLDRGGHKALVQSENCRLLYYSSSQRTLEMAKAWALKRCKERAKVECRLLMENERIVKQ